MRTHKDDLKRARSCQRQAAIAGWIQKQAPIENEFALDQVDEMEEDAPRIGHMNDLMQGLAQQASLDPGDDLGM